MAVHYTVRLPYAHRKDRFATRHSDGQTNFGVFMISEFDSSEIRSNPSLEFLAILSL